MKDAVLFRDLVGRLEWLRVECSRCDRRGRYSLARLIEAHGPDVRMTDFRVFLTRDCPHKGGASAYAHCSAIFPDLADLTLPRRR